ncbi:MAG: STAS domain-containing protein [Armatimonadota bacterium]
MTASKTITEDEDKALGSTSSSSCSFQFRLSHRDNVAWIEVRGDVEDEDKIAFRNLIFHSLDHAAVEKPDDIALDLSAVNFLSEEAVAVLIQALKAQKARGAQLRLVRPSPWVRKKLERTALLSLFLVEDS